MWKVLVLEKNTWNHITKDKSFISNSKTWKYVTVKIVGIKKKTCDNISLYVWVLLKCNSRNYITKSKLLVLDRNILLLSYYYNHYYSLRMAVWSYLNFLHNSHWIIFSTQLCLVLYSFGASLLLSLIRQLIVSSLVSHHPHLQFCCVLSIFVLIYLLRIALFLCCFLKRFNVSLKISLSVAFSKSFHIRFRLFVAWNIHRVVFFFPILFSSCYPVDPYAVCPVYMSSVKKKFLTSLGFFPERLFVYFILFCFWFVDFRSRSRVFGDCRSKYNKWVTPHINCTRIVIYWPLTSQSV